MITVLWFCYILDSLLLIAIILIQPGEGGDLASTFGGASSQTAFGARGSTNFLQKATTWLAVLFMVFSIVLVILTNLKQKNILEKNLPQVQPSQPVSAPVNPVSGPSAKTTAGAKAPAGTVKKAVEPAAKAPSPLTPKNKVGGKAPKGNK